MNIEFHIAREGDKLAFYNTFSVSFLFFVYVHLYDYLKYSVKQNFFFKKVIVDRRLKTVFANKSL